MSGARLCGGKPLFLLGCLVLLVLLEAVDDVGAALAGLLLLTVGSLAGVVAPWAVVRRRRAWVRKSLSVFLILAVGLLAVRYIRGRQITESFGRGDQIAAALAEHHAAYGQYPVRLSALCPEFLPDLPQTAMGLLRSFGFQYARHGADDYELRFWAQAWTGYHRGPKEGWTWYD